MSKSLQQPVISKVVEDQLLLSYNLFSIDSWFDIEHSPAPIHSFVDPDLASNVHINENLLLEAQIESSRTNSNSSRSERY